VTVPVGVPAADCTVAVRDTAVPCVTCAALAEIVVVVEDRVFFVKAIVNVGFH